MTFAEKILETAEEGIVLLRNEFETLPLKKEDNVAIFGRCQLDFYRSGMGSGGSVNVNYTTNLPDCMTVPLNTELLDSYRKFIAENPFDNAGGMWAAEPWNQKEMPVSSDLAKKAAETSNKAVFVIGRNAGEDKDLAAVKGSWFITEEEHDSLVEVCRCFDRVTVVFNTCGIVDTSWIFAPEFSGHITAVVYAWMGGQESGRACANILCGKCPSGKLTSTIAKSIDDYPSTKSFGSPTRNVYEEDIYVGYRYFSTFAPEKILYPFGFGLSYATFTTECLKSSYDTEKFHATYKVTNTSETYSGKETVQLYIECPQGKLGKSARSLAAFKKTKLLAPGESQEIELEFLLKDFASYDDSGKSGTRNCFVLEAGTYTVHGGTDSVSATGIFSFDIKELTVTSKHTACCMPEINYSRLMPGAKSEKGIYAAATEKVPVRDYDLKQRIEKNLPKALEFTGNKGIKFNDVKKDPMLLNSFVAQLTEDELASLVRGEGMMSRKVTPGIASAFGGLTPSLHEYGVPVAGCSDGPSGIRMDTGAKATLMPIGTQIASTWNPQLAEELFDFEGAELNEKKIDLLLGPGMNIQRNPLGGRNFEYFSEDPLITGIFAVAELKAMERHNVYGTIKHFAANNQENDRRTVEAVVSERALREIYLRGFEIAVKSGHTKAIMSSYNPINGHWTASNYDLAKMILRDEWGYKGIVMTDWWAEMNDCAEGGEGVRTNTAAMVRSNNDVYMVVANDGAGTNANNDNIVESLANGKLTVGELQQTAKNIISFLTCSLVSERPLSQLEEIEEIKPENPECAEGAITDGEKISLEDGKSEFLLYVREKAVYTVMGKILKPFDKGVSQSICNIMFDGKPCLAFDCQTTSNMISNVSAGRICLNKGTYRISLEHQKPGITLYALMFAEKIPGSF